MTETAFPLQWPDGRPRTKTRKPSKFGESGHITPARAFALMVEEVGRMGGAGLVVSSNAPLRRDGAPYADALDDRLTDSGVAVYFTRKGRRVCISCDTYLLPWENMRAICKTIEALRGIERWGAEEMLDRAFTGFAALPPPHRSCWDVLGIQPLTDPQAAWRARARRAAKDGDAAELQAINVARDEAVEELERVKNDRTA